MRVLVIPILIGVISWLLFLAAKPKSSSNDT